MARENEREFLLWALQNDAVAVAFIEMVSRIAQTLDDLVDRDRAVAGDRTINAFWEGLIELPVNPFYRQNELYLRPILASVLQDWRDSVVLERTQDGHNQILSFVLRDQLATLIIQCAYLIGGKEWSQTVGPAIRNHCHEDTFEEYVNSLEKL